MNYSVQVDIGKETVGKPVTLGEGGKVVGSIISVEGNVATVLIQDKEVQDKIANGSSHPAYSIGCDFHIGE